MSVLVDDLLLLARLDAGRPLEREPVDLSRLAIDVDQRRPGRPPRTIAGGSNCPTTRSWSAATSTGCTRCWPTC